jgi:cytochrome c oxidase subunit 2
MLGGLATPFPRRKHSISRVRSLGAERFGSRCSGPFADRGSGDGPQARILRKPSGKMMAFGRHLTPVAAMALLGLTVGFASTAGAEEADLARGKELFGLCAECHGDSGEGNELFVAPSIAGLELWYIEMQLKEFRTGLRGMHFDDIQGLRMRPMSLTLRTEDDVKAVSAYVASLPPLKPERTLPGDPAKGQQYYAICGSCHGTKAEGIQAMSAPELNHTQDWYLVSQVNRFKAGVRGSNPSDSFGVLMMNMARTLPDDQAVHDVVAYIMTLDQRQE